MTSTRDAATRDAATRNAATGDAAAGDAAAGDAATGDAAAGDAAAREKRCVVIIGGGLAGMAAAEAIVRQCPHQFDVTLVESRRQTGGRAGSFTDPNSGEAIDYCQHVAMGCCTNFLSLMDRCGLTTSFRRHQQLQFLHPDHPPSSFAPARFLPPPLHLARALGNLNYLNRLQRRRFVAVCGG